MVHLLINIRPNLIVLDPLERIYIYRKTLKLSFASYRFWYIQILVLQNTERPTHTLIHRIINRPLKRDNRNMERVRDRVPIVYDMKCQCQNVSRSLHFFVNKCAHRFPMKIKTSSAFIQKKRVFPSLCKRVTCEGIFSLFDYWEHCKLHKYQKKEANGLSCA